MNRMSPPAGVQARPTATPGRARPLGELGLERTGPEQLRQSSAAITLTGRCVLLRDPRARPCGRARRSRARGCARPPRACSCGSARASVSSGISSVDARRGRSLRAGAAPGSARAISSLSSSRVARQLDHLHAVAQRRRDRVEHVRGGDEEHLRQVERHLEVVVAEAASSARGRAPRAAPRTGRRGSRRRPCRSRRA